jgi:rhamnosyltransferase
MSNTPERFAVGFVVYSPAADFLARLEMINGMGYRVYIYDNSPEVPLLRSNIQPLKNIKYSTAGKNLGLAIGLSTICAEAYYDSFEALLYFDQDTVFDCMTIEFITQFYRDTRNEFEKCYTAVVFSSDEFRGTGKDRAYELSDVTLAISSGSLFFLRNLSSLGWHNETYFVDGVDYELCLRSLKGHQRIGRCSNTPGFDHVSGQPDKVIVIWGRSLPLRRYSLARIADASCSYLRLFVSSVAAGEIKFAAEMVRSYALYVLGQALARIILK